MTIKKNDIASSKGRIKTVQDERPRYISFDEGLVLEVSEAGITVNPLGMQAIVVCQPDDLLEQGEVPAEGYSQGAGGTWSKEPQQESQDDPEGTIAVSGEVAEEAATEEPEKDLKSVAAARRRKRR